MQVGVISPARWSLFRLSKQHLAIALARAGHDVVYVDPPVSVGSVLRDHERWRDMKSARVEVADADLRVWRPVVLPGQNSSFGQQINARLLSRGLQRMLPSLGLTVTFSLESRGLVGRLPGRRVYYCTDSFEDLPGADPEVVGRRERELLDRVDLVVACSRPLCAQLAARGADPLYLPHATDEEALASPPDQLPPDLAALRRPLVGYVGSLNFRIDAALLDAARRAAGDGTVVVVGERYSTSPASDVTAVLRAPNVCCVGYRSGGELAAYLSAFDVGLVPYRQLPFNRKSFPLKVLQYLAQGVPVVSSANGATDELGDFVTVADTPADFEAAVRSALASDGAAAREARRAAARARTWADNAARLVDSVAQLESRA